MSIGTVLAVIGAAAFGAVIGWITYFVIRRAQPKVLSDISTLIGILGGGTIVGLFAPGGATFAGYGIGLAIGFFGYYLAFMLIVRKHAIREVVLGGTTATGGAAMGGPPPAARPANTFDWGPDAGISRQSDATPK